MRFGWVKAYIGVYRNEKVDRRAKRGAEQVPDKTWITEGGLKQAYVFVRVFSNKENNLCDNK